MLGRLPAGACGNCELMGDFVKVGACIVLHVVMDDDFAGWIGGEVVGWWWGEFGFFVGPVGRYFGLFCGPYVVEEGW